MNTMVNISELDERSKADKGTWIDMLHPETQEPLTAKDEATGETVTAQMLIYGQAGRDVQDQLHEMAKAKAASKDEEPQSMKKAHEQLVETASVYIGGFRNVSSNEGDLSDASNVKKVLDMTFPRMEIVEGSALNAGGPKFRMANKPFALQAIEAASQQGKLLGNG